MVSLKNILQLLEEWEEVQPLGMFLRINMLIKFNIEVEKELIHLLLLPIKAKSHLNLEEMEDRII